MNIQSSINSVLPLNYKIPFKRCCFSTPLLYLQMKSHSIWFDSPCQKAGSSLTHNLLRQQLHAQQEQSHFQRAILSSPQLQPPTFKQHQLNPLSPWSQLINGQSDGRNSHLVIPDMFSRQLEEDEAIEDKLIYSEEEDEVDLMTPMKNEVLCKEDMEQGQQHTTGRKSQLQSKNMNRKSRPREKGLRKLSQKAYEIVQELKNATYKEVATKLVEDMNEEQLQGENKQQQNIKRRVYDALNVLIALGVLKKDGRKIVSERDRKGRRGSITHFEHIQALKQRIKMKQNLVHDKQRKLRQAYDKFLSITTLLNRNVNSECNQKIIPFPFIGIVIKSQSPNVLEGNIQQALLPTQDYFSMKSSTPLHPFGDIDSLQWLRPLQNLSAGNTLQKQSFS